MKFYRRRWVFRGS